MYSRGQKLKTTFTINAHFTDILMRIVALEFIVLQQTFITQVKTLYFGNTKNKKV